MGDEGADAVIGSGSVRDMGLPLGLYHDRLHNVYIAVGTLGAAIAIVVVVVSNTSTLAFLFLMLVVLTVWADQMANETCWVVS